MQKISYIRNRIAKTHKTVGEKKTAFKEEKLNAIEKRKRKSIGRQKHGTREKKVAVVDEQ